MRQKPAIGVQDFETIRKENIFYIDKTGFIKEWWETGDSVTLITRPRRFGKTLNMSMLECFFSLRYENRSDLFEGLAVWEGEYKKLQGTYPVIALSFANIKGDGYGNIKRKIYRLISRLYTRYDYLSESSRLNKAQKAGFNRIMEADGEFDDATAEDSLNMLCEYLSLHHGKRVIVLLDEYDTPMQEAYVYGYWNEIVNLIRNMFNSTFKTNPYLDRAVLTGITRISNVSPCEPSESIFSDLNNLSVVTTTSDRYATAFGFTEEEVFAALDNNGMQGMKSGVKQWYDGFTFGKVSDIYNPWSIINFLAEKKFKTYWANTSSNSLVGKLIREGTPDVKQSMEDLIERKTICAEIDEQIVFSHLSEDADAIWSLLIASGYLKVIDYTLADEYRKGSYTLALTNFEVKLMFENMINSWFAKRDVGYNGFIKAMLRDDREEMNAYMNDVALSTFSYFDRGSNLTESKVAERFYHGFALGLMVDLRDRYYISSNRESGLGRYDVMLEPAEGHSELDAIVIEFKVMNPKKETSLEDTVKAALNQIREKNYDAKLIAKGIPKEKIRHYGFAFKGKEVLIG